MEYHVRYRRPIARRLWCTLCNNTLYTQHRCIILRRYFIGREREREMYLTTHSTHFIYGYIASDIWLRTILIVRKETRCHNIGYSYRLTARVLLYAPSHRQDNTYHYGKESTSQSSFSIQFYKPNYLLYTYPAQILLVWLFSGKSNIYRGSGYGDSP